MPQNWTKIIGGLLNETDYKRGSEFLCRNKWTLPKPISVVRFNLPQTMELIGEGGYASVFAYRGKRSFRVLRIEPIPKGRLSKSKTVADLTSLITKMNMFRGAFNNTEKGNHSLLALIKDVNPFVLKTSFALHAPMTPTIRSRLQSMKSMSPHISRNTVKDKLAIKSAAYVQIMKAEYIISGSIRTFNKFDPTQDIPRFIFQIVYSLASIYAVCGIVHYDIKPSNILIDMSESVYGIYTFNPGYGVGPYYLNVGKESGEFPGIIKIIDFGTSEFSYESREVYGKGTWPWVMPVLPLFFNSGLASKTNLKTHRSTDVFSIGILVLSMVTVGWNPPIIWNHLWRRSTSGYPPFYDQKSKTIHSLVPPSLLIPTHKMSPAYQLALEILSYSETPESNVTPRSIIALMALCQLNSLLGNGFVPVSPLDVKTLSPVCKELLIKRHNVHSVFSSESTNIISLLLVRLNQCLGSEGVDFVRNCLSWKSSDRPHYNKLLSHPMFSNDPILTHKPNRFGGGGNSWVYSF